MTDHYFRTGNATVTPNPEPNAGARATAAKLAAKAATAAASSAERIQQADKARSILERERILRGLTQQQLGYKLGLGVETVEQIERGYLPSAHAAAQLKKVLHLDGELAAGPCTTEAIAKANLRF